MLLSATLKQARSFVSVGIRGVVSSSNFVTCNDRAWAPLTPLVRPCSTSRTVFNRGFASEVQRSNSGSSGLVETGGGLGGTSGVSKRTDRKCTLVLEDGSVFSGQSFGSEVQGQAPPFLDFYPFGFWLSRCRFAPFLKMARNGFIGVQHGRAIQLIFVSFRSPQLEKLYSILAWSVMSKI
jgi:hypothetical protein